MTELQRLLENVEKDIQATRNQMAELLAVQKYLGALRPLVTEEHHPLLAANGTPKREVNTIAIPRMTQVEAAKRVLTENGGMMSTSDIAEAIIEKGYYPEPRSKRDLKNSLFSIMRKKRDVFRKAGRGFWVLNNAGQPIPRTRISREARMSVPARIMEIVNREPDKTFTTSALFDVLNENGGSTNRGTVKDGVAKLVREGFLEVISRAVGPNPARFKKKS